MASKVLTKTSELIIPAGLKGWDFIDGIYVDGRFFEENIPILGATLLLRVKPTKDVTVRGADFSTKTFQNAKVETVKYGCLWQPLQDNEWTKEIDFGSAFYGVGLNLFYWVCATFELTQIQQIFTVNYELEVKY